MGLIETLVIGSYVWTTALGGWLYRKVTGNHLKHLEERVQRLEDHNPH